MLNFILTVVFWSLCIKHSRSGTEWVCVWTGLTPRYSVTRRGAPALIVAGYEFVGRKRRGARVYWTCRRRGAAECPARATTLHGRLLSHVGPHTHPPDTRIDTLIETLPKPTWLNVTKHNLCLLSPAALAARQTCRALIDGVDVLQWSSWSQTAADGTCVCRASRSTLRRFSPRKARCGGDVRGARVARTLTRFTTASSLSATCTHTRRRTSQPRARNRRWMSRLCTALISVSHNSHNLIYLVKCTAM